jgi:hypothetical protein
MSNEIQRVNTPDGGFSVEAVSETHTTWLVDAEKEQVPRPRHFRDLGIADTKLVVLSSFLPEPYASEAERIYEDIVRLERMMARERLDDEQDVRELTMGNLDVLPEVEADRDLVSHREDAGSGE